jgi:hypothetical protein
MRYVRNKEGKGKNEPYGAIEERKEISTTYT